MGSKLFAMAFNDSDGNVYFMISLFLEIVCLAKPKSISLALKLASITIFSGLISLWTIPLE